ncbi:uridine diphosphate-N-acetylglucosamine-binding protein YvcK [bacterium]|nr:uridine diphosphate-N-acetylglucosamine-binding protein YvcK [bacterium]
MSLKRERDFLTWFLPGMGVKRWAWLSFLGMLLFGMGIHGLLSALPSDIHWGEGSSFFFVFLGLWGFVEGVKRMNHTLVQAAAPQHEKGDLVGRVYARQFLKHRPHIVAIGGGTGLSALLRGLKSITINLSAIVTVADSGGSSGRLREEYGSIPPGDIRNCLVALAQDEERMEAVFQYRFPHGDLEGHSLGNLILHGLAQQTGNWIEAVENVERLFALRGRVIPAAGQPVTLVARKAKGVLVRGEAEIPKISGRVEEVWIEEKEVHASRAALDAIGEAEFIVLGPGSLYTSILPNLLFEGMAQALRSSPAVKIYVSNLMTQPGETDGMSAEDHLAPLVARMGPIDYVLLNQEVEKSQVARYWEEGASPVGYDLLGLLASGIKPSVRDLRMEGEELARHDSKKVAEAIAGIASKHRRKI